LDLALTEKVTMANDLFMRRHVRIRGHAKTVAHCISCDSSRDGRLHEFDHNPVGSVPLTFLADGIQFTASLSLLGNNGGRMSFQMSSYVIVAPSTPVAFDLRPDNNLPPGRIQ